MLEPDTEKRLSLTGVLTNAWVTENGKSPLLPMPPEVIPHSLREKVSWFFPLTHFTPMFNFYISWKRHKTRGFLTFSEGMKTKHWLELG